MSRPTHKDKQRALATGAVHCWGPVAVSAYALGLAHERARIKEKLQSIADAAHGCHPFVAMGVGLLAAELEDYE